MRTFVRSQPSVAHTVLILEARNAGAGVTISRLAIRQARGIVPEEDSPMISHDELAARNSQSIGGIEARWPNLIRRAELGGLEDSGIRRMRNAHCRTGKRNRKV